MRKLIIAILAVLLVLSCVMLVACDNNTDATGQLQYALTDDNTGYIVVDSSSVSGDVVVPDSYCDLPVVGISDLAFAKSSITSITIPDSVTYVGGSAFWQCSSLATVTVGNGVASIGDYAFMDCSKLATLTLGTSITSIGQLAFFGCNNLDQVYVTGGIDSWMSIDFANISANPMYYTSNVYLDNTGTNKLCDITDVVATSNTTAINSYAFYNCKNITTVTLSDSVVTIDDYAFDGIDTLATVSNTSAVTYIGNYAFNYCTSLTTFDTVQTIDYIGDYAFDHCTSLQSFDFGNSLTYLGERSFNYCSSLVSIDIPSTVTDIGIFAFNACTNIRHIQLAEGTQTIGYGAFAHTKITSLVLPDSVISVGEWCLSGCSSLLSIDFGSGIQSIGNYAFRNCSGLNSINLPDSLETIGDNAFSSCTGLDTVTIGSSVATIGASAFSDCDNSISNIYYNGSVDSWCGIQFGSATSNPMHTGATWHTVDSDGDYQTVSDIVISDSVTDIGDYNFYNCLQLTNVTIGNSVTYVGIYAFGYCANIEFVTFGNSVSSIGSNAFRECSSLADIVLPSSLEIIYNDAFYSCDGLVSVLFNNGLQSIGNSAFFDCDGLTSISLCSSLSSIGDMAFYHCSKLSSITLNEGLVSIGYRAFSWLAITELYIPASVEHIEISMSDSCKALLSISVSPDNMYFCTIDGNLYTYDKTQLLQYCIGSTDTSFTLPSTVNSVDDKAFRFCTNLQEILVEEGNTSYCSVDGVLYSYDKTILVRYPAGKVGTSYHILEGTTTLGMYALESSMFTHITMADTVTELKYGCFESCKKLETIQLSNNLQYIIQYAFVYCSSLQELTIPASVVEIGTNVVASCTGLTSITFEDCDNWYISQSNIFSGGVAIDVTNPFVNAQYIASDEFHAEGYCLYKDVE